MMAPKKVRDLREMEMVPFSNSKKVDMQAEVFLGF